MDATDPQVGGVGIQGDPGALGIITFPENSFFFLIFLIFCRESELKFESQLEKGALG
jgi:hypothetical protein